MNPTPSCPPCGGDRPDRRSAPGYDLDRHRRHFRPFDRGPGRLVRRNDPGLRERRPDRRPIRSQPTHRDGSLADLEQHSLGNHNGAFSGWVFGPGLPVSAGQPSSGAGADQFTATLWFRSASASADGSNIEIDLGSEPGDDRNTFLALTNRADADGGLQLRAGEPDGVTGNFRPTQIIATGITRSVWHRLDIVANFFDGPANDTVAYALDGVPLPNPLGGTTFGTFEGFFATARAGPYVRSNRLFFRSGAAPSAYGAFFDTAAQGFYFDDLFYAVANQSAPALRLAAYATGFEPGFSAGSIQGQENWSGGTIPISASVDQTVDHPVSTNAPGREPGGSRTTPHWATTTGPSPGGCSARASRCPLVSRHPRAGANQFPRRCGSAPRVRQPMAPTSRSISGASPAMTATPSWR